MAAAIVTLKIARRDDVVARISRMGRLLREGLDTRAAEAGLKLRQTGPAQMPMVLFEDDPDYRKGLAFCSASLREGAYFHPKHNMFLCAAHTEAQIEEALQAARVAFATVADMRAPA
jgi:glutamate-1-semialdehyde 2,1-aminomutase